MEVLDFSFISDDHYRHLLIDAYMAVNNTYAGWEFLKNFKFELLLNNSIKKGFASGTI